jgi:hypothetical protein
MIGRAGGDIYCPYLDHEWIEAIAAIPISERLKNNIQIDLIERLYPKVLDVPYAKNLIPLSASPWRSWMIMCYREVLQRVERKVKFINPHPLKIPNHNYSQWTRVEMRTALTNLLYNPEAAFRNHLCWEQVEPLLNQHFSGYKNFESLIAALTVFEIAHNLWVDSRLT